MYSSTFIKWIKLILIIKHLVQSQTSWYLYIQETYYYLMNALNSNIIIEIVWGRKSFYCNKCSWIILSFSQLLSTHVISYVCVECKLHKEKTTSKFVCPVNFQFFIRLYDLLILFFFSFLHCTFIWIVSSEKILFSRNWKKRFQEKK